MLRPTALRALPLCALALAALGCKPAPDARPAPPVLAKPAAAPALPAGHLAPVELARLEYLFQSAKLLPERWPWLTQDETCVLLLAPARQWVLNCDAAPPRDFAPIAVRFRGQAVFERAGTTVRSGGRELDTGVLLSTLPAAAHVDEPGAHASDLSPRHPWLLLGTLDALIAHHPSFREATTDEWLSVALHELFHARQLRAPGFARYLEAINRKQIDPAPLEQRFRSDPAYRKRALREYASLVSAIGSLDASAPRPTPDSARTARAHLARWYALYRQRCARLDPSEIESDRLFTFVEGVARYVESLYLSDPSLQPRPVLAGDPTFFGFARYAGRGYAHMQNRQLDPTYWYAIGFHLALLLDHADPDWKSAVLREDGWLIGRVERLLTPRDPARDRAEKRRW